MTLTNSDATAIVDHRFPTLSPSPPSSLLELWNPKKNSIADSLARQPQSFDFFQAVLVLENIIQRDDAAADSGPNLPIGKFHRFDQEGLKISAPATSAFPTAQIEDLSVDSNGRPRMLVNFMGLTGPSGMLPRAYTQTLAQVNRDGRGEERYALRDFLDQFNHRLISLFFVAWTKYRFPVRIMRDGRGSTLMEVALAACGGLPKLHTEAPNKVADTETHVSREQLLGFAGLLSQRPATAGNLQAVLNRILEVPTKVLQFQPSYLELEPDSQTCLGVENGAGRLGQSAVVGPRTMTRQHKLSIQIGPVGLQRFLDFLPGENPGSGYGTVAEIVRIFTGHSIEFDLQLQLIAEEVEGCRLETFSRDSNESPTASRLGFDSWLQSDQWPQVLCDAVIPGSE